MRAAALALACLVAACGTTRIRATDPTARIYVDGELIGVGAAEVKRFGTPATRHIDVATPDGRRGRLEVSRRFTETTLASVLLLSWVGLFAMWELPAEIVVPVGSGWEGDGDDVWTRPPTWASRP